MAFMLATRLRRLDNFRTDGGVTFRGNDPWYHFRETQYLLNEFPSTMPFDPWTNYPSGTAQGQFGTLFDQLVSGFILLTSLGDPSGEYIGFVVLVAAPVFVVLAVIPTYLIAAHFTGRGPALVGTTVLALLPGTLLNYSLVGFYDHHAAEVFFQAVAVLAFVAALVVAQREQPIWELVVDRDLNALRTPLLYSVGAGIAAALYMWVWPPGVLLIGFSGIYFALKITSDVFHDHTPDPVAFVGAVSMTVAALLMLVQLETTDFASTRFSLLQVILPLSVAVGSVFLGYLARLWEARQLSVQSYPAVVGGLILGSVGVVAVGIPSLFGTIQSSLLGTVGFSASATAQTVGEAGPFLAGGSAFETLYGEYGLTFFTALLAVLVILAGPLVRSDDIRKTGYVVGSIATIGLIYLGTPILESIAGALGTDWQVLGLIIVTGLLVGATFLHRYDGAELYVLVWAAFITSAAFTQVRFNYYLAIVVAVFTAIFVAKLFNYIDVETTGSSLQESAQRLEGWQVLVVVAAVLIITVPLLFPFAGSAWATGERNGPGSITQWQDSFEWLNSETPHPGELEGATNPLEHYGTYERPADGDFDYPEGAYGIQSWWDYGHWITTNSERIPNANPFQQGATEAANYLLAPSEQQAADALGEKMGENDQTRYVMVDWQMVTPNSKFGAPTVFYDAGDISQSDFLTNTYPILQTEQGQQFGQPLTLRTQRYYDSQMIRLYNYHGSAADPQPIVIETEPRTVQTQSGQQVTVDTFDPNADIQAFESLAEAESYVNETPGAQLGGIGANPTERVEALEHYRLVKASQSNALTASRGYQGQLFQTAQRTGIGINQLLRTTPHWVKTFERVPGATVEGTGANPGEEITATVEMAYPESDQTFSYTQYATADESGNFEMTLPYSTAGYDEFGPENGYTNTSVRATGQYTFTSQSATGDDLVTTQRVAQAAVTEAQVVGADNGSVSVELTEQTVDVPEGAQAEASG
jgi:dolichyl-diphosphooligosaccharide--protein glycosyltransferase